MLGSMPLVDEESIACVPVNIENERCQLVVLRNCEHHTITSRILFLNCRFYFLYLLVRRPGDREHIEFVSSVIEALCMSSSQALCALADFEESDTINTSGPLSGSGYHLYHENPRIILDLTYKCEEILERGRSALERMSRVVTA